ncbi:MAG: DUF3658 domain-containing protein [Ginsengibacter sp.]
MHIVFQQEDARSLMKSFELDDSLNQEIVEIKDDYSIGPIKEIDSEEGLIQRRDWWMKITGGDSENPVNSFTGEDVKSIKTIKNLLEQNTDNAVWIWVAANKRDVCGYYWLVAQLTDYVDRVFVLHLNNLPFINEKGTIFYPGYLYQIPPKEFLKAKKLARPVTLSEFEIDSDEWMKLGNESKTVRILEGAKKIAQYNADYFDEALLKYITSDWQKVGKVIGQIMTKSTIYMGDAFIFWRIKYLIDEGTIEGQGDEKNRKEFEVKRSFIQL